MLGDSLRQAPSNRIRGQAIGKATPNHILMLCCRDLRQIRHFQHEGRIQAGQDISNKTQKATARDHAFCAAQGRKHIQCTAASVHPRCQVHLRNPRGCSRPRLLPLPPPLLSLLRHITSTTATPNYLYYEIPPRLPPLGSSLEPYTYSHNHARGISSQ